MYNDDQQMILHEYIKVSLPTMITKKIISTEMINFI